MPATPLNCAPLKRIWLLALSLVVALAVQACSGSLPPDKDGAYTKAAHLFSGVSVGDTVDALRGDQEDWRKFRFVADSEVTLLVVMAPLADNKVLGKVEVYDDTFSKVHGAPVRPDQNRYELRFTTRAGADYYVVVKANDEAGPYTIRLDGAPVDPCRSCGPNEICESQRCVPKPVARVDPCGGCPPGQICDDPISSCVLPACLGVRCGAREFCDDRGRCRKSGKRTKRPRCAKGQVLKRGRCVTVEKEDALPPGEWIKVYASVVQVVDLGGGQSEVLLDKGKAHNLKKSFPPGRLQGSGARVALTRILAARSRAKVKIKAKDLRGKDLKVVFQVMKKKR